jgi:Raf kinase inhibitor-like YbhB/YbcL family protein
VRDTCSNILHRRSHAILLPIAGVDVARFGDTVRLSRGQRETFAEQIARRRGSREISVTSPAFGNAQPIPKKYVTNENISPALNWSGVPAGAKSIAVMVEDPDAPTPQPFVHWIVYNLTPDVGGLPEGVPHDANLQTPRGAMQGKNSMLRPGYFHPAPPAGDKAHHYHFQVYALDRTIEQSNIGRREFLEAIDGHVLAKGELVGTF